MALGRFDEAVVMFEKAAELDRQSSFPLVNLAFLHILYAPDASAAEEAARRLVTLDPDVANYHAFLGWALAVQLHFDEAIEELERTLELEPNHPYALPNLGYTLMAAGNPASAVLYLRRNLVMIRESESRPGERGAIIDLVAALRAAENMEEVQRIVDTEVGNLIEEKGDEEWILDDHANLSQLYAMAGMISEAEEQLVLARTMMVDNPDSQLELARCCAVLGLRECAIEETRKAMEMGFGDPFLPMLLPAMNSLLGDPEFMELFPTNGSELEL